MNDADFWDYPPEQRVWGSGDYTITLVLPPFSDYSGGFPAHDPVRAREFAESFGTIDRVLEETSSGPKWLETRQDLDFIEVGCWGEVIAISDPALADNGNMWPVLEEAGALHKRYPGARIVGSAEVNCGATHCEDVIFLPGVPMLHSEGWPGEDVPPWTLTGDPRAVLDAVGLDETDVELDEDPRESDWARLGRLVLGAHDPWRRGDLQMSVFRVRHTESATGRMEEKWLGGA